MGIYGNNVPSEINIDLVQESKDPEYIERNTVMKAVNRVVREFVRERGVKLNSNTGFIRNKKFKQGMNDNISIVFDNVGGDVAVAFLIGFFSTILSS